MIELKDAKISLLVGVESTTIEFHDSKSGVTFLKAVLTPEQLSSALSRLSRTDVSTVELYGLDKLGKKQEIGYHIFEVDRKLRESRNVEELNRVCNETIPDGGWVADKYYGSQDSFFVRDGKTMAKVVMRRWV